MSLGFQYGRGGAATLATPAQVMGSAAAWFDFGANPTLNGAALASVTDRSALGLSLAQATSANQGLLVPASNGNGFFTSLALSRDAPTIYQVADGGISGTAAGGFSCLARIKSVVEVAIFPLMTFGPSTTIRWLGRYTNLLSASGGPSPAVVPCSSATLPQLGIDQGWCVLSETWDASGATSIFVNGAPIHMNNLSYVQTLSYSIPLASGKRPFGIGQAWSSGPTGTSPDGFIAHPVWYFAKPTTAQRRSVELYLAAQAGLAVAPVDIFIGDSTSAGFNTSQYPAAWQANHAYTIGQRVSVSSPAPYNAFGYSYVYEKPTGTSDASTAPTTQGVGVTDGTQRVSCYSQSICSGNGWPELIGAAQGITILNLGETGIRAADYATAGNLSQKILPWLRVQIDPSGRVRKPRVTVMIGVNDGADPAATIYGNITTIVQTCQSFGAEVAVCTILNGAVAGLNALILANAAGADHVFDVVTANPELAGGAYTGPSGPAVGDGLHLNDAGTTIFAGHMLTLRAAVGW